MIDRFNEFINEGLRDKMVAKTDVEQDRIYKDLANTILTTDDPIEVSDELFEIAYDPKDITYYDMIYDFIEEMDINEVKNVIKEAIKLLPPVSDELFDTEKAYDLFNNIYEELYEPIEVTELDLFENMLRLMDINEVKRIAEILLKKQLGYDREIN